MYIAAGTKTHVLLKECTEDFSLDINNCITQKVPSFSSCYGSNGCWYWSPRSKLKRNTSYSKKANTARKKERNKIEVAFELKKDYYMVQEYLTNDKQFQYLFLNSKLTQKNKL